MQLLFVIFGLTSAAIRVIYSLCVSVSNCERMLEAQACRRTHQDLLNALAVLSGSTPKIVLERVEMKASWSFHKSPKVRSTSRDASRACDLKAELFVER